MLISLGLLGILIIYLVAQYNGFVVLKAQFRKRCLVLTFNSKRRADGIPNVSETVKGYAKAWKKCFYRSYQSRTALMGAWSPPRKSLTQPIC